MTLDPHLYLGPAVPFAITFNNHPTSAITPRHLKIGRTRRLEMALCVICMALFALGILGPSVEQPAHYHAFADQRHLWGIPNLMDVLSNLAFAGFAAMGAWHLWRTSAAAFSAIDRRLAGLFFFGLIVTAAFSGLYHLHPDNEGLAFDRYGMTIAFAGLLGLAASTRVSERAGQWLGLAVLVCGVSSIQSWSALGNVLPWAILQYGGMALMLALACLPARMGALPVSWLTVLLIYTLAKLLEHADQSVFELTHGLVSGHTLKHLVASCATLPVLAAFRRADRLLESPACDATFAAKR
jgi:hypothetical protein